ncbi:MAG: universal stress protein [Pseudonocardia sp.]|nr:universal stress protein [Pseudonocardia sp.]
MKKITVGVDGSPTSVEALRWAADVAGRLGAELDVVRAWRYPPSLSEWNAVPTNYGFLPQMPEEGAVEIAMQEELDETVLAVLGTSPAVTRRLVRGHPSETLIEESRGTDLLVIGRRGHSGVVEFLRMGSVARACTEHGHCAVVVVPVPDAD